MRGFTRFSCLLAAGVLIAGSARAQECLGYSSLENAKMNIAAVMWSGDHTKSYGADLNTAVTRSVHFGIGATSTSVDGYSEKIIDAQATLGISINAGRLQVCPVGFGGYSKVTGGTTSSDGETSYGGGVGAGFNANPGSSFELIPFGGLMYTRPTKTDLCGTDCGTTTIFAGLGLRFAGGIQLSPRFNKATRSGSKAAYGVSLSFPFGKK